MIRKAELQELPLLYDIGKIRGEAVDGPVWFFVQPLAVDHPVAGIFPQDKGKKSVGTVFFIGQNIKMILFDILPQIQIRVTRVPLGGISGPEPHHASSAGKARLYPVRVY